MPQSASTHRSVDRALRILMAFAPHNRQMGPGEIGRQLGLHPSTVSRLLQVLTAHGFIQQNSNTGKYSLGKSALDLGRAVLRSLENQLVLIARPIVDALCDSFGETVGLEVLSGDNVILAYQVRGERLLQVSVAAGARLPAHATAGAKAILAFSDPSIINRFLDKDLEALTPHTIRDPKVLKNQFEEIRRNGVSFDRGELDIDVHAIGAPIFDHKKKAVAAIVLAFPNSRSEAYVRDEVISQLKDSAGRISSLLLYSEDDD